MKELLAILEARARAPHLSHVLATVVRVEGSSYRRPGARMLVSAAGRVAGSVSGGCLERDVVSRSLEVLLRNQPRLLRYDTNDQDDLALGTSLGCQGTIEILLQPVPPGPWKLEKIAGEVLAKGTPVVISLIYRADDNPALVGNSFLVDEDVSEDDLPNGGVFLEEAEKVMLSKRPGHLAWGNETEAGEALIERIAPPLSLVIFGAGQDAPPLVRLAKELGHRVTVVDRRIEFARFEIFPEADEVFCLPPHKVHTKVRLGEGTAVVVMNHHYETDRALLALLLSHPPAYLAMLGPRKRTDRMLRELAEEGKRFPEEALSLLRAPAGLDLGAENAEQIALSILAEIQAVTAGHSAVALRSRPGPIHAVA